MGTCESVSSCLVKDQADHSLTYKSGFIFVSGDLLSLKIANYKNKKLVINFTKTFAEAFSL